MATSEDEDDTKRVEVLRGNLLNVVTLSGEPPEIIGTAFMMAAHFVLMEHCAKAGEPLTDPEVWRGLALLCEEIANQ